MALADQGAPTTSATGNPFLIRRLLLAQSVKDPR
jgi:hypothetical protein